MAKKNALESTTFFIVRLHYPGNHGGYRELTNHPRKKIVAVIEIVTKLVADARHEIPRYPDTWL